MTRQDKTRQDKTRQEAKGREVREEGGGREGEGGGAKQKGKLQPTIPTHTSIVSTLTSSKRTLPSL